MLVMRIEERIDGVEDAHVGNYLKHYDPTYHQPSGEYDGGILITTPRIEEAQRFRDSTTVLEEWRKPAGCACHGVREDGQPNRPLTAYTVAVMEATEAPLSAGEIKQMEPNPEIALEYQILLRNLARGIPNQDALDTLLSAVRPNLHAKLIEDLKPHLSFEPREIPDGTTKPGDTGNTGMDHD